MRLASRMLSAISFGVFCRARALDEADHPVDERLTGLRRDAHHDAVGQHARAAGDRAAVAAVLAHDRGRLAGDRRLVDGGDARRRCRRRRGSTPPASTTTMSPSRRSAERDLDERRMLGRGPSVAPSTRRAVVDVLVRVSRRLAGLRLAAALGHRLGEVGEEHRDPQPDRDAHVKPRASSVPPDARGGRGTARRSRWRVVSTAPTSTRNITGLRHVLPRVELAQCAREGARPVAGRRGCARRRRAWRVRGRARGGHGQCQRLPPGDPARVRGNR